LREAKKGIAMNQNLALWLNRIGLLLDLLSFWFVAPEILGEERLRKIEGVFENLLKIARRFFQHQVEIAAPEILRAGPIIFSKRETLKGCSVSLVLYVIICFLWVYIDRHLRGAWRSITLILVDLIGVPIVAVAAVSVTSVLSHWLINLADNSRIRQRSLLVGTLLFMIGVALQLAATF